MFNGDILEYAPAAQLFSRPEHEYTQRLIEAIPSADSRGARLSPVERRHSLGNARAYEASDAAGAEGGAPVQVLPRPRRGRPHRRQRRLLRAAARGRRWGSSASRAPARRRRRASRSPCSRSTAAASPWPARSGRACPSASAASAAPTSRSSTRTRSAPSTRAGRSSRSCSTRSARATTSKAARKARIAELLEMVGLGDRAPRPAAAAALRRPAPARRDRPGARPAAAGDRLRRAGLGARRLDPGPGARPARRPAGGAERLLPVHLPRPRRDPPHLRPGAGDERRQGGRVRRRRRRAAAPAPSLHAEAGRLAAGAGAAGADRPAPLRPAAARRRPGAESARSSPRERRRSTASRAPRLGSPAEALAAARAFAAEIAPGAVERDAERRVPVAELEALGRTGLLALGVPVERGGAGASAATIVEAMRIISAADPAIGQVPQNHFQLVDALVRYGDVAQKELLLGEVVRGARFGNAWSERGGKHPLDTKHDAARATAGLRLDGRKYYSTGALTAQWIPVLALDDARAAPQRSPSSSCPATPRASRSTRTGPPSASGRRSAARRYLSDVEVRPEWVLRVPRRQARRHLRRLRPDPPRRGRRRHRPRGARRGGPPPRRAQPRLVRGRGRASRRGALRDRRTSAGCEVQVRAAEALLAAAARRSTRPPPTRPRS